jgi:hypothetical protein
MKLFDDKMRLRQLDLFAEHGQNLLEKCQAKLRRNKCLVAFLKN